MNTFTNPKLQASWNKISGVMLMLALMAFAVNSNAQCSAPSYCSPTVTNLNTYYIGIQNVTIGSSINNTTTATGNAPFYNDYSNMSVFAAAGSTVSFSVQNGIGNTTKIMIYIDYNQDGTMGTSAPELAWSSSNTTANAVVSGTFTVPTGQSLGSYKIRITGDYGGSPSNNPCALNYGEIEDYSLIIGTSTPNITSTSFTPTSFAIGNNTITLTAKNVSTTTITALDFGYSCSNGSNVSTGPVTGLSITSGSSYTHTFSTPLNLTPGSYTLKIWANNPNGVNPDANPCGDTIYTTACTGMSGSYTINPSGSGSSNFTSFTDAVTKLGQCGISGPVLITISAGTYNEQIVIPNIPGASATNTVVFDGVDTTTRKISYNVGSNSNTAVIKLNGAKYVTIKRLSIENTSTTTNYNGFFGVQFTNAADYNNLLNCKVDVAVVGATFIYYPIPVAICGSTYSTSGNNGNNNLIDGNRLTGGYFGMSIYGNTTVPTMCTGNKITNNIIDMAYYYGIYGQYESNLIVDHNTINTGPYNANFYGIQFYYINNGDITRNTINSSYMGISFYTYNYYNPSGTINITNNMINSVGTGATFYGMYMQNSNRANIMHNTVNHTKNSGYAFYCFISDAANKVNNNIFKVNTTAAYPLYVGNVSTTYFTSFDYNTLSAPAATTNLAYFGGTTHATLTALKNANASFNQNNNGVAPVFQSTTDLHLSTSIEQARGIAGTGVNIDIDGDARCVFAPSIGADESGFVTAPPTAGFTAGTLYINSPVTFLNNYPANLPMSHKWYIDGVLVSTAANLTYTFNSLGTYCIALKSTNCSGSDSINNCLSVVNPGTPPLSDFISNISVVNTYQNVSFTDLSSNGPSSWLWSVSPGTINIDYFFAAGTSATSQNPVIYWATSGNYSICMRATNLVGSGSNRCKSSYIIVQAAQSMCIFPFSTKVAVGNLFSSGGPAGGYGQNENCTFTIDACADSTFLNITQARFGTGTVDRFEVYEGDYIPGAIPKATFLGNATVVPVLIRVKGKMTVREVTDASSANNGTGIKANWYTTAGNFTAPTGTINGPSNAYYCGAGIYNYYSSSFRDPSYQYDWDFDNDGITDFNGMDGYFSFSSTGGPDTIKLKISGCGGTITLSKVITVISPPKPTAAFSTTMFAATSTDTVQLNDQSTGGVLTWKWTITGPGSVNYVGGTSNSSRNPKVMAFIAGNYTVKLVVTNCTGEDSTTSTNYFKILGYCIPTAGNLLPDMTISKFKMGSINNTVTIPLPGQVAYRDYSQVASTNIDRGATYSFEITRTSNYNSAGIKIWVDWNQDGTFDPATELVTSTITGNMTWSSTLFTPKTATLGATRLRIGVAYNNLSNTPCGANIYGEFQDFRVVVRPDVTAPALTLGGSNPTYVEIGRNFVETGDVAIDAVDGNVTDSIVFSGYVSGFGYQMPIIKQTTALGTYTVDVKAEDLSDNEVVQTRTVIVTADTTKPVITLNGTNPMFVEVFTSFTDPGATATDFYFTTPITVTSSNNVDTAVLGSYTATYNATDANGNNAVTVTRTVIVRDAQAPVIVFPPNTDTVYVEVRSNYVDAGATVTDNYNTGLSATWSGSVNTFVPGTYYYTFHAVDGSGNAATPRVRVIIVRDNTAPELYLASPSDPDTLVLEVKKFAVVPEPGFVATDNYYASNLITVSKTGSVDLNKIGVYVVSYTATDPAGNTSATKRRIYKLVDTTKPVITLNGSNSVNICRWKQYTDLGAVVSDNYWNGLTVKTSSNLDMNLPGIYVISYNVTDSSGNIATTVLRYVNVLDYTSSSCQAFTGINGTAAANTIKVAPNPSNGMITIDIAFANEVQSEIVIYNSLGKVIKVVDNARILNAKYAVDMQNEASGIYFVTVKSEGNTYTQKFVLNK